MKIKTSILGKKRVIYCVITVILTGAIVYIGLQLASYRKLTSKGPSAPTTEIVSSSDDNPSEKRSQDFNDYKVPADQPRIIQIPSLDIKAYIQRVGIDKNNTVVAPNNIFFTGWFTGSAPPGDEGISILDGHVRGRYNDGVFRKLIEISNGEVIKVQMGDESWREFEVLSKKIYDTKDSAKALFSPKIQSGKSELRLITCDGVYDKKTREYSKRLIVIAKLK